MENHTWPWAGVVLLLAAGPARGGAHIAFYSLHGDGAFFARQSPCPDIPCRGSTCTCVSATGEAVWRGPGKRIHPPGRFTLQASISTMGDAAVLNGHVLVSLPEGTMDLPISGPALPLNGGRSGATPVSFTSPSESSVSSGTGAYRDPQASGTLTLLANTRSGHIVLDWGGSGDFR